MQQNCGRFAKEPKLRYMATFASFLSNRWKNVCFEVNSLFPMDSAWSSRKAKALANFKYKLKPIIAFEVFIVAKAAKGKKKKPEKKK